jgi:hypothetical protein
MTSVLYGAGLNYQAGNPVRQEIVAVRREVEALRKQVESLTEENIVYRKYIMKLVEPVEGLSAEFTRDLMTLSGGSGPNGRREAGGGTVQGGGFRR